MNNYLISFLFMIVMIILLLSGYCFIPGVEKSGELSNNFIFSSYMALLSFLATAAVIGPLTSQFIKYKSDKEWETARINACIRLNKITVQLFDNYEKFIEYCPNQKKNFSRIYFDLTIDNINEFMAIYDDEHVVFNPNMHSSCSNVRRKLSRLLKSLETTKQYTQTNTSTRMLIHRHDLDKLRALFDLPRLKHAENPTPLERHTFMNKDEPIVIEEDPFFFTHDKLFIDAGIEINPGAKKIYKFEGIDIKEIVKNWGEFVSSCPKKCKCKYNINDLLTVENQISAHAEYLKNKIEEDYFLEFLI